MNKKIMVTMLVAALCLSSVGVFAKQDTKSDGEKQTVAVTATSEQISDTDATKVDETAQDEDATKVDEYNDKDVKDVITNETEDETTQDEDAVVTEDKDDETDAQVEEGKSKVVKDELALKKQQRADARLEAKDYITSLRELFKDGDKETRKEILSEIAGLKKELKDYSIGVFVKGQVVDFEKYDNVKPIIKDNRTLIPVRAITESLGAVVAWDEATSTITITKGENVIVMKIDEKTATVNGVEVELETPPTILNNRTMVPVRFISENLKLNVEWDDNSQTVVIEE